MKLNNRRYRTIDTFAFPFIVNILQKKTYVCCFKMANWGCKEKETKCGVDDGFWKLSWIQKKNLSHVQKLSMHTMQYLWVLWCNGKENECPFLVVC